MGLLLFLPMDFFLLCIEKVTGGICNFLFFEDILQGLLLFSIYVD
jgi:hypothetical protein